MSGVSFTSFGWDERLAGPPLVTILRRIDAGRSHAAVAEVAQIWHVLAGEGGVVLSGVGSPLDTGDTVQIPAGCHFGVTAGASEGIALLVVAAVG